MKSMLLLWVPGVLVMVVRLVPAFVGDAITPPVRSDRLGRVRSFSRTTNTCSRVATWSDEVVRPGPPADFAELDKSRFWR